jgi:hypothetical protein
MTKDSCLSQDLELLRIFKSSPSENLSNCSFSTQHTFTCKRQYNKIRKQYTNLFKQEQKLHKTNLTRQDEHMDIKNAKTELERKRY